MLYPLSYGGVVLDPTGRAQHTMRPKAGPECLEIRTGTEVHEVAIALRFPRRESRGETCVGEHRS